MNEHTALSSSSGLQNWQDVEWTDEMLPVWLDWPFSATRMSTEMASSAADVSACGPWGKERIPANP